MTDENKPANPNPVPSPAGSNPENRSDKPARRPRSLRVFWLFCLALIVLYYFVGNIPHNRVPSAVGWQTDWHKAVSQASTSGKVIFADFYADWCGPCREMDHDVFSDKQVAAQLDELAVPVRFDLTERAGQEVARMYNVYMIPAYIIFGPDGKELSRADGMLSAEQLLAMVHRQAETIRPQSNQHEP